MLDCEIVGFTYRRLILKYSNFSENVLNECLLRRVFVSEHYLLKTHVKL